MIKQNSKFVHKEAVSFDREVPARAWMTRRERDLHAPGGLEDCKANKSTVANLITVYLQDLEGSIGRTKAQALRTIHALALGEKCLSDLRSEDIVSVARELKRDRTAGTVSNYLAHLSSGCCQTNANSSQFSSAGNWSGRKKAAPFGKSSGAVLLEILSAVEVTRHVEKVMNSGVYGHERL